MLLKNVSSFQQPYVYLLHFYSFSPLFASYAFHLLPRIVQLCRPEQCHSVSSGEIPLAAAFSHPRFLKLSTNSLCRPHTDRWVILKYNSQTVFQPFRDSAIFFHTFPRSCDPYFCFQGL